MNSLDDFTGIGDYFLVVHVFICSSFIHSAFTEHHIGIEHKAGDGPLPSWRLQSDGKCGWVNVHLQSGVMPVARRGVLAATYENKRS